MEFPDRTFDAIIFDWDGTAVPDRSADASSARARVEALSQACVDVAVVSGTHVGNIDGQLQARPAGYGRLFLCPNRGSEVFKVDEHGPQLVWRRQATPEEDSALDRAAALTITRLAARGLRAEIVSQRLNRRKIDLIPEPEWADPPKARIAELLAAVTERLHSHGIPDLAAAVELAVAAAKDAGLADPRVTSDAKHVEIGLTDKSDSSRWMLQELRARGIGAGLVLIAGDEFGPMGGIKGSDAWMLIPEAARAFAVSVGDEPDGVPDGVGHLGGGPATFLALLDDQLGRRRARRTPAIDEDPAWTVAIDDGVPELQRVHESLLTVADGHFGTRGALEENGEGSNPFVVAAGIYSTTSDGLPTLLPAPPWPDLAIELSHSARQRRVLDMHTGVLLREAASDSSMVRTVRFSSLARPGVMGLRAEGPSDELDSKPDIKPVAVVASRGGIAAATWTQMHDAEQGLRTIERIARYVANPRNVPGEDEVAGFASDPTRPSFDQLLAEHRAAWASRWDDLAISIEGDPAAERAARFALFQLASSVADDGEAAVGARGLSGHAYLGHVFWDADVFVLPALAATHPAAARAMLEYRIQRLPAARALAAARGFKGARFPWESAGDGDDVTPRWAKDRNGKVVSIQTGTHEEHIVADVAWGAWHYAQWSGDGAFLNGPGQPLITDTARYWASRVRLDPRRRAHLYGVEGPDEYHGPVDDNAFTNLMARWNLRRAADLVEKRGAPRDCEEAASWRAIADALVDGYDAATGRYEQFAGFFNLEPLLIAEFAHPPVAADLLLGPDWVAGSQIIKQADVLMLHHLIPEEVAPGSLLPNLTYYGPRTAHGSSLSPAIQGALLARAGQPDAALELFRIALRIDLEDLTGTTAGGLHLATFGGVWQALAYGFLGLRPTFTGLTLDPQLPATWTALEMTVRFRGRRVRVRADHETITVSADAPVPIEIAGRSVSAQHATLTRKPNGWEVQQ